MAEGGGAAPPEAVRRGVSKTVFAVIVVVVAIVAFFGGVGLGPLVFPPAGPANLVVGTNTPFPPFEFRNQSTDEIQGFDIDLITSVMNKNSLAFDLYDFRDFSALLTAVQTRRVDIVASSVTSNGPVGENRSKVMSFSNWWYEADQGTLKKASDTRTFCADSNNCLASELNDLKIVVQTGTSSEFWVEDNLLARECGTANFTCVPDVVSALNLLASPGPAAPDILVVDLPVAQRTAAQNPSTYATAGTIQTNERYAYVVAKGDPLGLLPKINAALRTICGADTPPCQTGSEYEQLVAKWFSS